MSLFKAKGLDEEIREYLEQELEDLSWLEERLSSCKDKKFWEEEFYQTNDKIKHVTKLLKKLKG